MINIPLDLLYLNCKKTVCPQNSHSSVSKPPKKKNNNNQNLWYKVAAVLIRFRGLTLLVATVCLLHVPLWNRWAVCSEANRPTESCFMSCPLLCLTSWSRARLMLGCKATQRRSLCRYVCSFCFFLRRRRTDHKAMCHHPVAIIRSLPFQKQTNCCMWFIRVEKTKTKKKRSRN